MTSLAASRAAMAPFVPYVGQIAPYVVSLHSGDWLQSVRLRGAYWLGREGHELAVWRDQWNNLLRNLAHPGLALWVHVIRRRADLAPPPVVNAGYASMIDAAYRERLQARPAFENDLYLSLLYRPHTAAGLTELIGGKRLTPQAYTWHRARFDSLMETLLTGLSSYGPQRLGCYQHHGIPCSELLEFLGGLINGEVVRQQLTHNDLRRALPRARAFFGADAMSLRTPTRDRFIAALGVQEYPSRTPPALLNGLLSLPFEFSLAQSFAFVPKDVAQARIERHQRHLDVTDDPAVSQADALAGLLDDLISNRVVMGTHHLSLLINSDSPDVLAGHISTAGRALSDAAMKWVREDTALASSFWSQLPGNFAFRVSRCDISSRNFAGLASLHSEPAGKPAGYQWGPAVTTLRTASEGRYHFSFHPPQTHEGREQLDSANTLIVGATGSGKTALAMLLVHQLQRFQRAERPLTPVVFDILQGCSIAIGSIGTYLRLRAGEPTGWAPFQVEGTPRQRTFLQRLVRVLVRQPGRALSPSEEDAIAQAVDGVLSAPRPLRRVSALLQFLDPSDPNGLHARILPWCQGGPYGWVFDNPVDRLSLANAPAVGFDLTDLLKNDDVRTPSTLYLLHRVLELMETHRVPLILEEAPRYLNDPEFAAMVNEQLVTIRKLDGFLVLLAQFPRQILECPAASAIVSQTRTKIFFPDPHAQRADYVDGFKLTDREFALVRALPEGSRRFLIRQGEYSVVAGLDLRGLDPQLAILAGNPRAAQLAEDLQHQLGVDPSIWVPEFLQQTLGGASCAARTPSY